MKLIFFNSARSFGRFFRLFGIGKRATFHHSGREPLTLFFNTVPRSLKPTVRSSFILSRHWKPLFVFIFFYIFIDYVAPVKSDTVFVECKDNYAIKLDSGFYLPCESYDAYFIGTEKGQDMTHLLLTTPK